MFPLFPALIFLLLQGPSNFDRLAFEARLPAALEAIHRQMAQPGAAQLSEQQEQALATLIASGSAAQISQALFSFLWSNQDEPLVAEAADLVRRQPAIGPGESPPPSDGYAQCRRTRDGPLTIGAVR
jgi:hypothetical protein